MFDFLTQESKYTGNMQQDDRKDIFISYRNDGISEQFGSRLQRDLVSEGYSVYFNPEEKRTSDYREKLKQGVTNCKDFILIVSRRCLETLKENKDIDWVRYEILVAREQGKNFIPILINGTQMPSDSDGFPEELSFLPFIDAIPFPSNYLKSPFHDLLGDLISTKSSNMAYKNQFAGNARLDICSHFAETLKSAENGNIQSMFDIACMYYWGIGGENKTRTVVDYERAVYWLKRVINESDDVELISSAQGLIGRLYYRGCVPGEEQSYEKAYQYQKMAAVHNNHALAELAYLTRTGCGCKYDYNHIVEFYDENISQLNNQEIMVAATYYVSVGQYKKAAELYESVDTMTPEMEFELGMLYKKGVVETPPRPDLYRAAFHLRNAADANNLSATYQLGLLYFNPAGDKRIKDFAKAHECFLKGARSGHAQCQYILGFMYKFGYVEKDLTKAIHWLEKAVAQGNTNAAIELVPIYWNPAHCNYQRAYECAEMSAYAGIPEGELFYGASLLLGRGCITDVFGAKEWLKKAEMHGVSFAQTLLQI